MVVAQLDGHFGLRLRVGEQEGVLERLVRAGSLLLSLPLLEQGGERRAVDDGSRRLVAHRDVAIARQRQLVQVVAASAPAGELQQFAHMDVLFAGVPRKGVVDAQGAVVEKPVEVLRPGASAEHSQPQRQKEKSEMLHIKVHL